jgi:hypothetical protein
MTLTSHFPLQIRRTKATDRAVERYIIYRRSLSRIHHPTICIRIIHPASQTPRKSNRSMASNSIKPTSPDSKYPSSLTKKHNYLSLFPKPVLVKPIKVSLCSTKFPKMYGNGLAAPTLTPSPKEQASWVPDKWFKAATAMTDRLSEERSSEDMRVAQRSSLAVAEKGPFPIHSVQPVLRF